MSSSALTILVAQWRSLWHFRPAGGRAGRIASGVLWFFWYGLWTFLGVAAGLYTAVAPKAAIETVLPLMLMGTCVFWQFAPILTAQAGASLDLRKLLLYPVSDGELFAVELLLRLTTAAEVVLVLLGIFVGLVANPNVPHWQPAPALLAFIAFNLFLSAGLRSLLERLLAIRFVREIVVLTMVLLAALPQLLAFTGWSANLRRLVLHRQQAVLPWSAAAHLALGELAVSTAIGLTAWTAAAYVFGRVQFRRNLRFDSDATRTLGSARGGKVPWASLLYRVPRVLFSDPLAAMIEKDLRSLARAPRFRIVFFMGFSFGAIIWWPVLHDAGHAGVAAVSYPVAVSGYAMLLLAEVAFWNQFGFDRNSAQFYFSAPVPFSRVLLAKNVASMAFVLFEVVLVLLVCTAVRIPLPPSRIAETLGVTLVLALFFLAAGNLNSVYNPRPVNPEHSWGRTAAGRFQVYMLLLFPVMLAPIALAYLAAYAFDSRAALFAVLGFDVLAGAAAYYVASGSAVAAAERRQEEFLGALAQSAGPIVAE